MKLHAAAGEKPVHAEKDVPGFIGNWSAHAPWREAIALVENGICDAETVDNVIKAAFGRGCGAGPLENADMVGNDLTLVIDKTVLPDIDSRPGPSPYPKKLVKNGKLVFKVGRRLPQAVAAAAGGLMFESVAASQKSARTRCLNGAPRRRR